MKALNPEVKRDRTVGMKRLQKVVDLLRKLPPERFDFSTWVGTREKPFGGNPDLSCGTVACALGWAATIPSLRDKRRAGLRLEVSLPGAFLGSLLYGKGRVVTGSYISIQAAEVAFALTHDEALYVFTWYHENSALRPESSLYAVADNMQAFIDAGGIPAVDT